MLFLDIISHKASVLWNWELFHFASCVFRGVCCDASGMKIFTKKCKKFSQVLKWQVKIQSKFFWSQKPILVIGVHSRPSVVAREGKKSFITAYTRLGHSRERVSTLESPSIIMVAVMEPSENIFHHSSWLLKAALALGAGFAHFLLSEW